MRRFLIAAPAAFALTAGLLVAAPAFAKDEACATTPAQLRNIVTTADATAAKQALRYIATGEKLCEAGADREAGKKFAAAMKVLNVDSASLTAVAAAK
jgi:hypothetical protein